MVAIAASASALCTSAAPLFAQSFSEPSVSIDVENLEPNLSTFTFTIPEETPLQLPSPSIEVRRVVKPAPSTEPTSTEPTPTEPIRVLLLPSERRFHPTSTTVVFPSRPQVSDLPDGRYRLLVSPRRSRRFSDGLPADGRVFAFRKIGDVVTGTLTYLDTGESACVTGNLDGNIISGQAFRRGPSVGGLSTRTSTSIISNDNFGLSLLPSDLTINSAVLNLSGAALIDPGRVAPPAICP